jgi:hypothetical protein
VKKLRILVFIRCYSPSVYKETYYTFFLQNRKWHARKRMHYQHSIVYRQTIKSSKYNFNKTSITIDVKWYYMNERSSQNLFWWLFNVTVIIFHAWEVRGPGGLWLWHLTDIRGGSQYGPLSDLWADISFWRWQCSSLPKIQR